MSTMDKSDAAADSTLVIEFDRENGLNYTLCQACCVVPLLTACIVLPCLPCLPYCQRQEFESQQCKVTDKRIEYEGGWMNHVTKNVPLDRIQDVSISQGCVQRCFNIKSLNVQTAGGSSDGAMAEVMLLAPKNAEMVRDLILQRRDHFVLGPGHGTGIAAGGGIDDITRKNDVGLGAVSSAAYRSEATAGDNYQLMVEIRELKETVSRIEKHIVEGLAKMDEPRL